MPPHYVVAIGVRLFVLWLVVYVLGLFPALISKTINFDDSQTVLIAIGVLGVIVVIMLALWFFPRAVARGLLPVLPPESSPPPTPDALFAIGCALIGLWTLANAIPDLIRFFVALYINNQNNIGYSLPMEWKAFAANSVARFIVAIWLLLGAKGARKLFWWARNAGT